MMLDTNNNTAGTGESENQEGKESPQSIIEKRLAELNARQEADRPAEKDNSTTTIIADTIAGHEVMPPVADQPAGDPVAPEAADPGLPEASEPAAAAPGERPDDTPGSPLPDVSEPIAAAPTGTPVEAPVTREDAPAAPVEADATAGVVPEAATAPPVAEPDPTPPTDIDTPSVQAATAPGMGDPEEVASTAGMISQTPDSSALAADASPEAAIPTAAAADHDHHDEHHDELLPETDYSTLSTQDLRQQLLTALKNSNRKNARQIYDMHRQYDIKMAAERAEALQRFVAEGNDADDFQYNTGLAHQEVEQAFQQFRENRSREQRMEEEQRVKNSRRKQELLEQLRELVESPETKSSAERIKAIQTEWKTIGSVPPNESQQLWNSYHALLDIFYNNRSIFFELKELDRRKNLQHKLQLCERAEALVDHPSINTALQDLRHLHEEWKNIGPVPNDQRDAIWERFIQASEKIHARKKEFINERRQQEGENLVKKLDLLSRIAPFQQFQTDRINDWRDKTDEIQKLKEEWDAIGLVPKERADEVNKQFWASYKAFFNHKNAFFKSLDEQKMQNLRLKTELCEQAESLKDSTDWDETKEKLIQLQKKWKTIGRVPDKYSDKLWNRFRAACNEFFDRRQNQAQQREAEISKASAEKTAFFEEVAGRITRLQQEPGSLDELEAIQSRWESFDPGRGHNKLDDKFLELLQQYVDSIPDLTKEEKDNVLIQLQVANIKHSPDASHRLHQKEQSIRKEIAHLENDIRTLKTNIEFFGRSKNADKWRGEYQARIEEADRRIQLLQQQLYAFRNA